MAQRTTKLLGFAVGAMVSIVAIQAAQSASLGPFAWGVDPNAGGGEPMEPNASFSIVQETGNSQAIAPHDQWFSVANLSGFTPAAPGAGNSFDPQAHDITWIWDFGDAASVPHPSCNLPTEWRDTNVAYGKRVAHVFDGPGTYTVTCWAYDQDGHYGIATTTVTVLDPAVVFAGNRTICVNPAGDNSFPGAPAGAQQVQVAALGSAIEAVGGQTCRILFKRGATFVGDIPSAWNHANSYYHAYGPGADPILRPSTTSDGTLLSQRGTQGNKFVGLDYHGRWDVESETGNYDKFLYLLFQQSPVLIHKCRIRNSDGMSVGTDVIVSASRIENWRGFAFIPGGSGTPTDRYAIIGSALHMSPNACQGQYNSFFDAKLGNFNGPIRIGQAIRTFLSATSIFSNTGWSANGNSIRPQTERNRQFIQSCIRFGSDPSPTSVLHTNNIERVVCENGGIGLMQHNSSAAQPSNFVLDKVIVLGSHDMYAWFVSLTGGTTVRNLFCWQPNVPISRTPAFGFMNDGINNGTGAANRRVRAYGCTFYSALTGANKVYAHGPLDARADYALFEVTNPAFTDLVAENNVVHCPAQPNPLVAAGPVQIVAIPGLTTLYRGPRWNFPPTSTTLGADVPNGGSVSFPYPDDSALHPSGRATNQAYFLTPPGNNEHMLGTTGEWASFDNQPRRSARGEFSVTFGPSNITVTNTSGQTWTAGRTLRLLLDRRNDIRGPLSQFASPATVEVPVPIAGSPALAAAGVGLVPVDDLYGRRRLAPQTRGAVEVNV